MKELLLIIFLCLAATVNLAVADEQDAEAGIVITSGSALLHQLTGDRKIQFDDTLELNKEAWHVEGKARLVDRLVAHRKSGREVYFRRPSQKFNLTMVSILENEAHIKRAVFGSPEVTIKTFLLKNSKFERGIRKFTPAGMVLGGLYTAKQLSEIPANSNENPATDFDLISGK